jgi:hypothetical protein
MTGSVPAAILRGAQERAPQDDGYQNGFVTIPPSTRRAATLVALEAF